jgi:hypothetical protein
MLFTQLKLFRMSQLITTGDEDAPNPIEGVRQPLKSHNESQV